MLIKLFFNRVFMFGINRKAVSEKGIIEMLLSGKWERFDFGTFGKGESQTHEFLGGTKLVLVFLFV